MMKTILASIQENYEFSFEEWIPMD
ncbi:DUF1871 family protein [Bacillus haikouensis]|nr:DUF1871 family protein [Bacillus haikouensis]